MKIDKTCINCEHADLEPCGDGQCMIDDRFITANQKACRDHLNVNDDYSEMDFSD